VELVKSGRLQVPAYSPRSEHLLASFGALSLGTRAGFDILGKEKNTSRLSEIETQYRINYPGPKNTKILVLGAINGPKCVIPDAQKST
jgi:hypothetical protein